MRVLLLLVPLLLGPFEAAADERPPIGQVVALQGVVTLERLDGAATAVGGERLHAGDRLVTGFGSRVLLRLDGGLSVVVGAATDLGLERVTRSADGAWSTALDLARGIFRAVLGVAGNEVNVETALAITSVRSTEWTVEHGGDRTAVFAREGRVEVTAAGATVVLTAGEGTDVRPETPPTAPAIWGAPRVEDTLERTRFGGR